MGFLDSSSFGGWGTRRQASTLTVNGERLMNTGKASSKLNEGTAPFVVSVSHFHLLQKLNGENKATNTLGELCFLSFPSPTRRFAITNIAVVGDYVTQIVNCIMSLRAFK